MTDESCEGYTNYETFTIGIEIDNDQGTQERWLEAARNSKSAGALADELKEAFNDAAPELTGVYQTLLSSAMSEINWYELAEDLRKSDKEILGQSIELGPTSSGSGKLEDIVEGVEDLLPEELYDEFQLYDDSEDDEAARNGIFEEVCDYLNEIAPEGVHFGAQEGDGACWGFWKNEEDD